MTFVFEKQLTPLIDGFVAMTFNDAATLKLARSLQCRGVPSSLPMPCPNRSAVSVFHVHLAKMGGRSLMKIGPHATGHANCHWFAQLTTRVEPGRRAFWGHEAAFAAEARAHSGDGHACFASWEAPWPLVESFGGGASRVVVLTMLRGASSWMLSAVAHKQQSGHTRGVPELLRRGCFDRVRTSGRWDPEALPAPTVDDDDGSVARGGASGASATSSSRASNRSSSSTAAAAAAVDGCRGVYPFAHYAVAMLDNGDFGGGARVSRALRHLGASVFGVVEHFELSLCLIGYSFGSALWNPATCACKEADTTSSTTSSSGGGGVAGEAAAATTTTPATATGERAVYPASNVTLDEMRRATEAMALHEALYARALALFFRRAEAVERLTGVRLLCE